MMKLNLGCGKDIKKGWINLDKLKTKGVDVVHDLNELPLPFSDQEFDYILCQDILEHVDLIPLMNEIHRIFKKNGILKIRVPHFTSMLNYKDPTHRNLFSIGTFNYFVDKEDFQYKRNTKFFTKIISGKIIFNRHIFHLKIINYFLEKWVNKSYNHQFLYENSFLRIFPAMNIEFIIMK